MKNQHPVSFLLLASAFMVPAVASAQSSDTNELTHFSFSARFGFNINAHFKNVGPLSLSPRLTPRGNAYNYDNGYVLTDISGNAPDPVHPGLGPVTTYWGYDKAGQIGGSVGTGQTVTMDRSTIAGGSAAAALSNTGMDEDDVSFGGELVYDRELGTSGNLRYGFEAAVNYLNISFDENAFFTGDVNRSSVTYQLEPGTQAPQAPPYQGTFQGPGIVLPTTPIGQSSTIIPGGAIISSQGHFDGDLWGFRLGPYLELPLCDHLNVMASGGLAVGLLDASASWTESASVTGLGTFTGSGSGNDLDPLWGYYLRANATYQFSESWSAEAGVQYQDLGTYNHNFGGRTVEVDLSKTLFLTVGVGYRF